MYELPFINHLLSFFWSELYLPYFPFMEGAWAALVNMFPVIVLTAVLQLVLPAVIRKPKISTYEYYVDLFHLMFNSYVYLTFIGGLSGAMRVWMQGHTPEFFPFASDWPVYIQVVIAIWMFDFLVYWRHRLSHEIRVLWPIHAVHHTSQQVDVLTTHRLHFLEMVAGGVISSWASARSGLSPQAVAVGFMIYIHYNHFIHTNINIKFSGPLRYILVSPFVHRWHHAKEPEAVNKNYAVVFAWNDWIFGSAYHPEREPYQYGIEYAPGEATHESYINHQLYPFAIWLKRIYNYATTFSTKKTTPTA